MKHTVHLKSPGGWINDPNGFIYYKNKYHLFYQYFPYDTAWGTMHWGHAISDDLVKWEHLGVAIYPSKIYDRNGAFSGSAVEKDGKLRIYYTGVKYSDTNPENVHLVCGDASEAVQVMIESEDGFKFDNLSDKIKVIPVCKNKEIGDIFDCRDPKVWKQGEKYQMVLGSTFHKKEGVLQIHESCDGINWNLKNTYKSRDFGIILECPDLFYIDGKWVLVASPIAALEGTDYPENQSVYYMVNYDFETGEIELTGKKDFIDYGMEIYAPQSAVDKDGNRVQIAWVRMPGASTSEYNDNEVNSDWIGMMTIPRIVKIKNDKVYFSPHDSVRMHFDEYGKKVMPDRISGNAKVLDLKVISFDNPKLNEYRCVADIKDGEEINIQGFKISYRDGRIFTDRSNVVPENIICHKFCKTPIISGKTDSVKLEIYYDLNLIEVFINDGEYVITNTIFA